MVENAGLPGVHLIQNSKGFPIGIAVVDDHRKPALAGGLKLGAKRVPLHISGRAVVVEVQSHFTQREHFLGVGHLEQGAERGLRGLFRVVGVQADRAAHVGVASCNVEGALGAGVAVAAADGEQARHPGGASTSDRGIHAFVAPKNGRVQVTVGVDHRISVGRAVSSRFS